MKRISLDELAKTLKVSKTLISLVLNGKGNAYGISAKTQKKVLEKAKELDYRPNLIARGLRTGRSNVIGLIVADISNTFYATIARSIEAEVRKLGYQLMVCSSEEDPANEKQLIDMLVGDQNANGIIVATTQMNTDQFRLMRKDGIPLVLIDRMLPDLDADYVGVNNYQGAFDATEHLIKMGHKKIALFTISPSFLSTISERKEGYRDALKKHKLKYSPQLVKEIPFDDIRNHVHKELIELVAPPNSIDALFTLNNTITTHALDCLNEAGLRIPQDVAVISFDDVEYFRFVSPPLTAVSQPMEEIGSKAVELLAEQISKEKKRTRSRKVVLPTQLNVRKSCGSFLKIS